MTPFNRFGRLAVCAAACLGLVSCATGGGSAASGSSQDRASQINARLSPGVNYGNVLEANPPEGWGQKVDLGDFQKMAAAGFKSLRLPVRWNAMAGTSAPYTIRPDFFARVDNVVRAALQARLHVVLNIHHYDELFEDPSAHRERFVALWKQIAAHYSRYPDALLFELLNEPHGKLDAGLWDPLYKEALAEIRRGNPTRVVVVSGAGWGGAAELAKLNPPADRSNLIFTFHYYSPFQFTHQGAEWVGAKSNAWVGTQWRGTPEELRALREEFAKADAFARRWKVPMYLGEYGAYSKADMESRVRWTARVGKMARQFGFSRAYWEFKTGGFGVYKPETETWNQELLDAVLLK